MEKGNGKLPNLGRNRLLGSVLHFVLTLFAQKLLLSKKCSAGSPFHHLWEKGDNW